MAKQALRYHPVSLADARGSGPLADEAVSKRNGRGSFGTVKSKRKKDSQGGGETGRPDRSEIREYRSARTPRAALLAPSALVPSLRQLWCPLSNLPTSPAPCESFYSSPSQRSGTQTQRRGCRTTEQRTAGGASLPRLLRQALTRAVPTATALREAKKKLAPGGDRQRVAFGCDRTG